MAITVNSAPKTNAMASAVVAFGKINVDLDTSYPDGGYDVSADLPGGSTLFWSETIKVYDATNTAIVYVQVDIASKKVKVFQETNGAKGAEVSAAYDCTSLVGLEIGYVFE